LLPPPYRKGQRFSLGCGRRLRFDNLAVIQRSLECLQKTARRRGRSPSALFVLMGRSSAGPRGLRSSLSQATPSAEDRRLRGNWHVSNTQDFEQKSAKFAKVEASSFAALVIFC
jgi:hypothetical protein